MDPIVLRVIGTPQQQGSKNAFVKNGKAIVVESKSKSLKEWRRNIATVARGKMEELGIHTIDEPVSVNIEFFFPTPASDPYRVRHTTTPDIDKMIRAVCDALVQDAPLLKDDSRVFSVKATKLYCHLDVLPGASITIERHGEAEELGRKMWKEEAKRLKEAAKA